jgi:hypothetical protein
MSDEAPIRLYRAFVAQDPASAIKVIEDARSGGTSQAQLFDTLFAPALALLGAAWAAGEVDEVTFTQAAVVAEQITSFVTPPAAVGDTGVTVLIGCMHKDRHAVVKNIVGAALKEAGNRVVDLGVDVRPAEFLEPSDVFATCWPPPATTTSCSSSRAVPSRRTRTSPGRRGRTASCAERRARSASSRESRPTGSG